MRPEAEIVLDRATVQGLIGDQHADLAHLPLHAAGEGWDNWLFRLGDDYAVRVPRRWAAASLIENEQRWLPVLAPALPLPVPVPLRVGGPGRGVPWGWSITRWHPGESALAAPPAPQAIAPQLGSFLRALHRPAPPDAPHNPWRSIPLRARTGRLEDDLRNAAMLDAAAVRRRWERIAPTPPWQGPRLWIHGDLHPGNLLVRDGGLAAVLDFGDVSAGDPAVDLALAWMLFPAPARAEFLAAAKGEYCGVDRFTVMRASGWALALGVSYVANARDDPRVRELGIRTVGAVLAADEPAA